MLIFLTGILAGILIALAGIRMIAPYILFRERECKFGFEQAVAELERSVLEKGWKIPAVHDLRETMLKFGKPEVDRAKVFEVCHPDHAFEILSRDEERTVMPMMPCRIAVYQKSNGKTFVSVMHNGLLGMLMKGAVPRVMKAASRESEDILRAVVK